MSPNSIRGLILALIAATLCLGKEAYLFSYFTSNGEDGLHLAYSEDGYKFKTLKSGKSFLKPDSGLMRDPSIIRGPDGVFHMTWTTGWGSDNIGYAQSPDLIHWSEQKFIPVMAHEPTVRNCWAPEIFYDEAEDQFLVVWSSTIPGRFPETDKTGDNGYNHRMYYLTTKDFKTFSETRLFYDGGFNVIDGFIARDSGRYILFLKDETKEPTARKDIRIAYGSKAEGPYGPASPPISISWAEGPTALKIKDEWFVYYDEYTRKRYGAIKSRDLQKWEVITDKISFPKGVRHGTAFAVTGFKIDEKRAEGFAWEPFVPSSATGPGHSFGTSPNPSPLNVHRADGKFRITVSASGPFDFKIMDAKGRIAYSESSSGKRSFSVPGNFLEKGLYVCALFSDREYHTAKIIVAEP